MASVLVRPARLGLQGLSPRVRGSRDQPVAAWSVQRSIPAGAGEPQGDDSIHCERAVFPRGCGGADSGTGAANRALGLSPACAGEPAIDSRKAAKSSVYPRVCGGAAMAPLRNMTLRGLSPRVRGSRTR